MVINTVHSINVHKWHVNVAKVAFIAKGCFDPLQLLHFPASLNTVKSTAFQTVNN